MFLDLFFYLFFNGNEINVNIPNFCPPVYNDIIKLLFLKLDLKKSVLYYYFSQNLLTNV